MYKLTIKLKMKHSYKCIFASLQFCEFVLNSGIFVDNFKLIISTSLIEEFSGVLSGERNMPWDVSYQLYDVCQVIFVPGIVLA